MPTEQLTRETVIRQEVVLLAPSPHVDEILREYRRRRATLERTRFERAALGLWVAMLVTAIGFLAAIGVSVVLDLTGVAF